MLWPALTLSVRGISSRTNQAKLMEFQENPAGAAGCYIKKVANGGGSKDSGLISLEQANQF